VEAQRKCDAAVDDEEEVACVMQQWRLQGRAVQLHVPRDVEID